MIHGNKSQGARTRALKDFKDGRATVMVATDIAARGIDIDQLPAVINYELPMVAEDYVHRIGRTGRAGADGQAISLVCAAEAGQLRDIQRLLGREIDSEVVEGFEPLEALRMGHGGGGNAQRRPAGNQPSRRNQQRPRPNGQAPRGRGRDGGGNGRPHGHGHAAAKPADGSRRSHPARAARGS